MPRPKRTKTADAPRVAAAPTPSISAIPTHVSSPNSHRSITTSDDSDGLVTKKPGAVKFRNPLHRMVGALPVDAVTNDGKPMQSLRARPRKERTRMAREDDAAKQAIENLRQRMEADKKAKAGQRPGLQAMSRPAPTSIPAPPATLQVQRSQPDAELEPEVEVARHVVPSSAYKRAHAVPMSARKPISTPRAEASMLALANFKRRSRAPSILGIGAQEDDTASISSTGSFGDLVPDDESTPLPRMRQTPTRTGQSVTPAQDSVQARDSSSRKRKRGSNELRVPNSQREEIVQPSESLQTRAAPIEIPSDEPESSSDESLPKLPTEDPNDCSHTPSSTMAPPASSSPSKPTTRSTKKRSSSPLQGRFRKKARNHGLAKAWDQTRDSKKSLKVIDTATLQDLLPRRKAKAKDGGFSIWSSDGPGAGTDDDELSFAPTKRRGTSNRARQALGEKKTLANGAKGTSKISKPSGKAATPLSRTTRTYSRRQSDQENAITISDNEGQPSSEVDETTEISPAARGTKHVKASNVLDAMARKFADVDNWKMEFEEASGSSDALKNAR